MARAATILPNFVGLKFRVHNGKVYNEVAITEAMVGHKLGEFSPSESEPTPLQALSPIVIANSQLMLPRRPSSSSLTDTEPSLDPRSSNADDARTFIAALHLPQALSDPLSKHKPSQTSASRIYERSPSVSASARSSPSIPWKDQQEEQRQVILSSFAPRVAVYTSADTEDFIRLKGFSEGLRGLLRPFGEQIPGKIVIRDSIGASRGWEDFGIRFIDPSTLQSSEAWDGSQDANGLQPGQSMRKASYEYDPATAIEKVIDHHLGSEGELPEGIASFADPDHTSQIMPSIYQTMHMFYLRKLLSSTPIVPYETFAHPVACIIAISSRNLAPIDTLRQLYATTGHGSNGFPPWINTEYLRYYVLVHDEENDDITKSTALFDLMKRHFGLHCHLLRLRSSQCVPTDDDSIQVPLCKWLSADEELAQIRRTNHLDDVENREMYIHESDATAIRGFLREMVTQSIVPFMEGRVTTWNDQAASRRRGISGRFMSLSKRFAGFGSTKGLGPGTSPSSAHSGSNFDALQGFYPPATPEATMRQLADYAFMLRDWKLAYNTYEFLRADFGTDKAWMYHAAANEMSAISFLLIPQNLSSKARSETVDQVLEVTTNSYLTRSSKPFGAVRCLTLAIELLKSRGFAATEDAANWGTRLLDLGVLTPIAQAFTTERIADCYRSVSHLKSVPAGDRILKVGTRKRQTAFWDTLASKTWAEGGKFSQARRRLQLASVAYQGSDHQGMSLPFPSMQGFWEKLEQSVYAADGNLLPEIDSDATSFQHTTSLFVRNKDLDDVTDFDIETLKTLNLEPNKDV
ncbi:hypothetical protein MMC07_002039 [Pseudocyphellaria aurata]|nr:hypothetical protein [Pseudocyphellaria aurata]